MDRILLVDDENNILKSLKRILRHDEWEVETFDNPESASKAAQTRIYDLFISDLKMPGMNGIEFLQQTKEWQPTSQRILLTGQADLQSAVQAVNQAEIFRLMFKPWNDLELIDAIEKALHYRKVLAENKYLAEQQLDYKKQFEQYQQEIDILKEKLKTISDICRS